MSLWCIFFLFLLSACGCGAAAPVVEDIIAVPGQSSEIEAVNYNDQDWPLWRGPRQNGIVAERPIPLRWSETENVVWKVPVAGRGHSSPIIIGDLVVLTTAIEEEQSQTVLGLNRSDGTLRWDRIVNSGGLPPKHRKNSFASSTPASDGERVFVAFVNHDRLQVVSLDLAGDVLWETDAGGFRSEHGYGASVTLFGSFVIVCGDSRGAGFLAALNRATGEIAWRTSREPNARHGNYATPIVAELAGKPQLIQAGFNQTVSYDPATGRENWSVTGPSTVAANTIAVADPYVVVSGGFPEKQTMCIKADGTGPVDDTHVLWSTSRNIAYVPSPIADGNNVLVLTGDGILTSFDLKTGDRNWQERIGGNFTASPVRVGDHYFVPNERGETIVFRAGDQFEIVSRNTLNSPGGMASLSVAGDQLFVRTDHHLYCLADSKNKVTTTD